MRIIKGEKWRKYEIRRQHQRIGRGFSRAKCAGDEGIRPLKRVEGQRIPNNTRQSKLKAFAGQYLHQGQWIDFRTDGPVSRNHTALSR